VPAADLLIVAAFATAAVVAVLYDDLTEDKTVFMSDTAAFDCIVRVFLRLN